MGCEIVKLFPGGSYGQSYVKAIKGPQPWTSIMPTGGVSPTKESIEAWFSAGVTCVGMGSKLISNEVIASGDYKGLENTISKALALIKSARG